MQSLPRTLTFMLSGQALNGGIAWTARDSEVVRLRTKVCRHAGLPEHQPAQRCFPLLCPCSALAMQPREAAAGMQRDVLCGWHENSGNNFAYCEHGCSG